MEGSGIGIKDGDLVGVSVRRFDGAEDGLSVVGSVLGKTVGYLVGVGTGIEEGKLVGGFVRSFAGAKDGLCATIEFLVG